MSTEAPSWQPVQAAERYSSLDLLRGFALFGVLAINLLYFFRLSLWDHIVRFHSDPGTLNHAIDILATGLIEFKAFDSFAFTFGIGMAIQAERASQRSVTPEWFLIRRFLVLLAIGACHMVLLSNVDILMLYATLGLLLTLAVRIPAPLVAIAGLAAIYAPTLIHTGFNFPSAAGLGEWAANATRHYAHGNFPDIVAFRWQETRALILPLLIESAQNTAGMMLLGMASWRMGVIRNAKSYRTQLWIFCAITGPIGLLNTASALTPRVTGTEFHLPHLIGIIGSHVPLALSYIACLLAWRGESRPTGWLTRVAAMGQMALTTYLTQSLIFGFVFYGYGGGLFGRVAPAPAAAFGLAIYVGQLFFSEWWLRSHRFGPVEWLWRSATYGRLQPMLRPS